MSEEGKKEENKKERRFSPEQYDMLLRCSKKKDMTEWNEWRKANPEEEVLLDEAPLQCAELRGANLQSAKLVGANLQKAHLSDAHLEKAHLLDAHLEKAYLLQTHLENAKLVGAHLEKADLRCAHLEKANLVDAHLEKAYLSYAHLEKANLCYANLEKAFFFKAKLQHTDFSRAIVDGETLVGEECEVDRYTKFDAVAIGNMRICPSTRQLLEYNIRRMNWEDWYKGKSQKKWVQVIHKLVTFPVRLFWWMSDYGMSTVRVVGVFFLLAFLFAAVYMNWGYWRPPGIVSNLIVQPEIGEAVWHYFGRALIRPVYFSIVTMTTLGFGDMYANKGSIAGHVILAVQVILGYVLLGALITRFAVLFTAGGPAGRFAESRKSPG